MKTLSVSLLSVCALQASAEMADPQHSHAMHASWTCDIDGTSSLLEAEYETFDPYGNPIVLQREAITAEIAAGKTILFYEGRLEAPDATYVFTGEDHIAEFTDLATLDRFLVHFLRKDDLLTVTKNPNEPSRASYTCTLNDDLS